VKNKTIVKMILLFLLLALWIYLVIHYKLLSYIIHPRRAAALILSFHPYDDPIFIIIQIFQVLSAGLIPGALTEFIGGYLYGPVMGTIYSTIGMSIGSVLAFIIARKYGLPVVQRIVRPSILEQYDHFMEERGVAVTLILFLIPGFPKSALCYIIGLSHMNIWTFIIISILGRLSGTALASISGNLVQIEHIASFAILMGVLIVLFIVAYFYRKHLLEFTKGRNGRKGN
jgi:uncharacterized membrane protein YdjX (TVP38/TMEM64 family)